MLSGRAGHPGIGPEEGAASALAVFVLFFLVAVVAAAVAPLYYSLALERRAQRNYERLGELVELVADTRALLGEDPTPESDSSFDPVWAFVDAHSERLSLTDLSSRPNPNFLRVSLLEEPAFRGLLAEEVVAAELQQRRVEEDRLFLSLEEGFADLFDGRALEELLTAYSYVNVNVADEEALERLYLARTGSAAAASAFRANVQGVRIEEALVEPEELQAVVGAAFDELFPLLTTEGEMNVHFVDPETLLGVLSYPHRDAPISNPNALAARFVAERRAGELSVGELESLLALNEDQQVVLEYLGTKTWFWRIRAEAGSVFYEEVVARRPEAPGEAAPVESFRVVAIRRSH